VGPRDGLQNEDETLSLVECAAWLSEQLGKEVPRQVHEAGNFRPVAGKQSTIS
jgi:hypothetical protein